MRERPIVLKTVLCVTHLSRSSLNVLEVAAGMALAYHTKLTILFPYRVLAADHDPDTGQRREKRETEARMKFASIRALVPLLDSVPYEFQPEMGFSSDRINAYVRKKKVHTIVISQRVANTIDEINPMALQDFIAGWKLPFMIVPEELSANVFTPSLSLPN